MSDIIIYTDGGCRGNPGPGAWGAIIITDEYRLEIGESELHTTNNKMELSAAIKSIEQIDIPSNITLYSDSAYLVNGMNSWIHSWVKNNWIKSSDKKPVENREYWESLIALTKKHSIKFVKVKGHSDNEENNRADAIVNDLMNKQSDSSSKINYYEKIGNK